MGRLVDIDEVIRIAENTFPQEDVRKIMWVLCHTPTVYDISKVVAKLEDLRKVILDDTIGSYCQSTITKAIDIVRKGGVE